MQDSVSLGGGSKKSKGRKTSIGIEPWEARKNGILAKFTTSEKLSIVTSFLGEGEKGKEFLTV